MKINRITVSQSKIEGRLLTHGVILEKHEMSTIVFFLQQGYNIELIPPSLTPKTRNPDFKMQNLTWEAKNPQGASRNVIERTFRKAAKQSSNIILDLRRLKMGKQNIVEQLTKLMNASRRVRSLILVISDNEWIEFKK